MQVRDGIVLFQGSISTNVLIKPMVSNAYLLEDGDEIVLFDPSCGKEIAGRIEAHIRKNKGEGRQFKKAIIVAGHSHIDHANNFYLGDLIGAKETHILVHEKGFKNGAVKNEVVPFIKNIALESNQYYKFFSAVSGPVFLPGYFFMVMDKISRNMASSIFGSLSSFAWPGPVNGSTKPELLKEENAQKLDIEGIEIKGWRLGTKVILPTPGHSPCSVSLFWPERKAIFISDADWYGNPVFVTSSLRDCISSLEMIKKLTQAGKVDVFLPAHGEMKEGRANILGHLDSCIQHLEGMKKEVLAAYQACGEKNIIKLTRILVKDYPLFKALNQHRFPKAIVFIHNITTVCLKEEGIIV